MTITPDTDRARTPEEHLRDLADDLRDRARQFARIAEDQDTIEAHDQWHRDAAQLRAVVLLTDPRNPHRSARTTDAERIARAEEWLIAAGRKLDAYEATLFEAKAARR